MGKSNFTKKEKNWILYDVGNSAFTMLVSTLIPIYFNSLAKSAEISSVDYLAYWGYAVSAATMISSILGLFLGGLCDHKGYKKIIFFGCVLVGAVGCASLGFSWSWVAFIAIFIIADVAYADSLVCYDAMLPDVTNPERMDVISSNGYAWGYIGSCILFGICLVLSLFYNNIGISISTAMTIGFIITALWWVGCTMPLMKSYTQIHYAEAGEHPVKESLTRLVDTFKKAKSQKHIFIFLLAFFCFIDGVYTIINMATAYGTALGLNSSGLLIALLLTQFVAFPCSIIFGKLSKKYPTGKLICVCIAAYLCIAIYAIFLHTETQFFILAVAVGMFQGGIQSLSRSYYAKLIPPKQSGEYFSLFDICGKGASFIGTTLVGAMTQLTGSMNFGVGILSIVFVIGLVLFIFADRLSAPILKKTNPDPSV